MNWSALRRSTAFYVPPVVLCVWGTVLLQAAVSGRVAQVLHPMFRPWVEVSSGLLLLLAVFYVLVLDPPEAAFAPSLVRSLATGFWLTGPLLVAALMSPNTFSLSTLQARGFAEVPSSGTGPSRTLQAVDSSNPSSPVQVEVMDVLMSAQDPDLVKSLEGRMVRLTGQYAPAEKSDAPFRVVRMWMLCCAADARPIGVDIQGAPGSLTSMDWVEVTGTLHYTKDGETFHPTIQAGQVQRTAQPQETFVY
jgi:uncharacterized repeat protein (TIGR03943 family)